MHRVTLTMSFDVFDPGAFIAQANVRTEREWGSPLQDIAGPDTPLLVQAAFETFIASNGEPWPEGTSDDANVEYHGSVVVKED